MKGVAKYGIRCGDGTEPGQVYGLPGNTCPQLILFTGDFSVFENAEAICSTPLNPPLDSEFIAQLPDCVKLIANVGVGYDNIDLAAASAHGMAVTNTRWLLKTPPTSPSP